MIHACKSEVFDGRRQASQRLARGLVRGERARVHRVEQGAERTKVVGWVRIVCRHNDFAGFSFDSVETGFLELTVVPAPWRPIL
jgi:hypothetical protein